MDPTKEPIPPWRSFFHGLFTGLFMGILFSLLNHWFGETNREIATEENKENDTHVVHQ